MAKNFEAQIQVKDKNSISTLQKIMKETDKLKKSMDKIGAKPIQMKVKEDSTFKKAQDDLKKLANPKINPIQLKVNDSLTPMMHKLEGSISNTFRQINSQVGALAPKLAALNAASAGTGAGLLGGAAAGRLLGGRNRGNGSGGSGGSSRFRFPNIKLPDLNGAANWGLNATRLMTRGTVLGLNVLARNLPTMMGPLADAFDKSNPFMKKGDRQMVGESWFSMMIDKQKKKMDELNKAYQAKSGKSRKEYLPQYKMNTFNPWEAMGMGDGPDVTMMERTTKGLFERIKNGASSVKNSLKTMFSGGALSGLKNMVSSIGRINFSGIGSSLRRAFTGINFRGIGSSIRGAFGPGIWNSLQTTGTRALFGIQRNGFRALYGLSMPIAALGRGFLKIPALAGRAFGVLGPIVGGIFRGFGAVGRMAFKGIASAGKIALKGVGSVFSILGSGLKSALIGAFRMAATAGKAALVAATAAVGVGIHGLAQQESNAVSMKHFIKNGNAGMSDDQVKTTSDAYMKNLTQLGNETPFENPDIYGAGRKAVQVTGGNTSQAMDLTRLAADMAALNPGKTVEQAMEALADLKRGEAGRMGEFSADKYNQTTLNAAIGKDGNASLTAEEANKAFEVLTHKGGAIYDQNAGGSKELSTTLSGKWSTMTGTFGQMMVDAMVPFSDSMKGTLDSITAGLNAFGPKLTAAMQKAADMGKVAFSFLTDLGKGDSSNFPIIEHLVNSFNILKKAVQPIVDSVSKQFDKLSTSVGGSFGDVGEIIEKVSQAIADRIEALAPVFDLIQPAFEVIKNAAIACWPVVQGIVRIGAKVIGDIVEWLKPVLGSVGSVFESIGKIVADVWPSIETTIMNVWKNLQPVLDLLKDAAGAIADVFNYCWPGIADVIKTLWGIIGPLLEALSKVIGGIAWGVDQVIKKFKEWGEWMAGNSDKFKQAEKAGMKNPFAPNANPDQFTYHGAYDGGGAGGWGGPPKEEEKADGSNAWGLNRVPFDGYKSILHEGERVLTAREARQQDAGSLAAAGASNYEIHVHEASNPHETAKIIFQELQKAQFNRG